MDNDGVIDLKEMAIIMETMDDIDGVKPGRIKNYIKSFESMNPSRRNSI